MRRRVKEDKPDADKKHQEKSEAVRGDQGVIWSWRAVTIVIAVILLAFAVTLGVNVHQLRSMHDEQMKMLQQQTTQTKILFQVKMTHLRHVFGVLERLGYEAVENNASTTWHLLWAHDYPFHAWSQQLRVLRPNQKVNHFPGTGYVTTKVTLATSGGLHIPPAFRVPEDKEKLLQYSAAHPNAVFVEKNNDHRSVQLRALNEIDLEASRGSFLQEFVSRPLLISGHKFDIGVYTVITSVDPLRIYKYQGDVLFRFCLEAYEPFNASNTAQYVIGEDYLPAWQVPALKVYTDLGYSRLDAFDAHIRDIGKDPRDIWRQVDDAISAVYLKKEKLFSDLVAKYRSRRSFFEMVRFDFIVDDELRVYLLEANMSPNLSSMHYPPNALLYEQVLYSLLTLVGVSTYIQHPRDAQLSREARDMVAAELNLMVYPEQCSACESCNQSLHCQLCKPCLSADAMTDLRLAYLEHINRNRCKRIWPPPMSQDEGGKSLANIPSNLTQRNELMLLWFRGKCLLDRTWCQ
ncbi:hypothetical protein B566_EDAN008402 [Ephemera danica]|nr:hypothetical protein B566_EDAN008402 [Ephemera danica]